MMLPEHAEHGNEPAITVFFSPHQDDELLTMGVYATRLLAETGRRQRTYAVLCTDGAASQVRHTLRDGRRCRKHRGTHAYDLDESAFTAARDREFADSCKALGFAPSHVGFHPLRARDGSLTIELAQQVIASFTARFPGERLRICTLSPFVDPAQHRDHAALGLAAVNLYCEGVIDELLLFVEPYCTDAFHQVNPSTELIETRPDATGAAQLADAIAAYRLWAPEQGRYAIGYHSVTGEFDDLMRAPASFHHLPEDAR